MPLQHQDPSTFHVMQCRTPPQLARSRQRKGWRVQEGKAYGLVMQPASLHLCRKRGGGYECRPAYSVFLFVLQLAIDERLQYDF